MRALIWFDLVVVMVSIVVCSALYLWRDFGFPWNSRVLPTLLIIIDVAAAVGYGIEGGLASWRNVVYWLAAAALTYVVTYDGRNPVTAS